MLKPALGFEWVGWLAVAHGLVDTYRDKRPDVILLDLFLSGGMNGGEFLAEYRRSGGRAKVIVISGAARADPIARDLVVDEFIGKPFDLERLLESVRRFAYG